MMIGDVLQQIGLTTGEAEVYEALARLGTSTTGSIVKNANIGSSKVYEVLQRLHAKGLVSHVVVNGVKHFDATPPERLLDFLEEQKGEISAAQEAIQNILPKLRAHRNHGKQNSTTVYSGIQGPKIVLNEILQAGAQGETHYGFGTDNDPYAIHLPHHLARYIEQAEKLNFTQRLLFVKGFESPNTAAQVRYLPKEYLFPVRTMIYGNKVAIVDFTKPITTIIITNKQVAASYKEHFSLLWKIAKPSRKKKPL